jgi:hypothetical protein
MKEDSHMNIEIRLEPAGCCTRRPCLFCGELDNKESVIAAVYQDGEFTGYIVCPDYPARAGCIGATPAVLAERLRARAACVHAEANELEAIAADLPTVPTMEALQAALERWLDEVRGPVVAAPNWSAISNCVNDDDLPF